MAGPYDPLWSEEDRERGLRRALADLQHSYRLAAEPLIKALAEIESRKPPKPVTITRLLDGTVSLPKSDQN